MAISLDSLDCDSRHISNAILVRGDKGNTIGQLILDEEEGPQFYVGLASPVVIVVLTLGHIWLMQAIQAALKRPATYLIPDRSLRLCSIR